MLIAIETLSQKIKISRFKKKKNLFKNLIRKYKSSSSISIKKIF